VKFGIDGITGIGAKFDSPENSRQKSVGGNTKISTQALYYKPANEGKSYKHNKI
jgi:hypothetical protein